MTLFHCHLYHFNWFILKWQSECKMVEGKGCDGMFPSLVGNIRNIPWYYWGWHDVMLGCEENSNPSLNNITRQYCNITGSLTYRYTHYHSLIVLLSPVRHINIVLTVLDMFECNKQSSIPLIILYSRILTAASREDFHFRNISSLSAVSPLSSLLCFRVCLISLKFSPRPGAIICRIK